MSHFLQNFYLSRDPFNVLFVLNSGFFKYFYCNFLISKNVLCHFYLSKSTFTKWFANNIMAKLCSFSMRITSINCRPFSSGWLFMWRTRRFPILSPIGVICFVFWGGCTFIVLVAPCCGIHLRRFVIWLSSYCRIHIDCIGLLLIVVSRLFPLRAWVDGVFWGIFVMELLILLVGLQSHVWVSEFLYSPSWGCLLLVCFLILLLGCCANRSLISHCRSIFDW